ncbi:non-specific lipid-transfer protein 1-like [Senna tora]|uniref:Non-specific lipid-transfer protein n=1 Tax=Senna tora TaxID=362788 RepID=A0A834XJZ0_9FABA|nr:non-specific lipid-transfer protein 1-like [Senna tora]
MGRINLVKLACFFNIAMIMLLLSAPTTHASITCGQVTKSLAPCLGYLQRGGAVPPACCAGIRGMVAAARTTADRQGACNCIKSTAARIRGLNQRNAQSLPDMCKYQVKYSSIWIRGG